MITVDGSPGAPGPVIALTGATGFLGSHIADTLLDRGYRVRASIRATSSLRWLDGKPVEIRQTDLTDAELDRLLDPAELTKGGIKG